MNKSFTLIEILVVIVVIGIISAFILVGMDSVTSSAKIAKGKVFINSIDNSLLLFRVSEWNFDERVSAGDLDVFNDLWNKNTLTLSTGDGTTNKIINSCPYQKCLSFDGNNDYLYASDISLVENSDVSFIFWEKVNVNNKDHDFVTKGYHTTNSPLVIWYDYLVGAPADIGAGNSDTLSVITYDGTTQHWVAGTSNILKDNNWHNIAILIDNTNNKILIYIDGVLNVQNTKIWNGIQDTATIINPGTDSSLTPGIFLNGSMDDFRIYNQVIQSYQIQQNYYIGLNNLYKNQDLTRLEFNQRISQLKYNLTRTEY